MRVKIDTSALAQSRWYEYLVRFAFGGTITALTGLIAKRYGPEIGGLFLAFPAILPATATLIEKNEKEKKMRTGKQGTLRGRNAAGVDAAGAAMGSAGLAVFALIVWKILPDTSLRVTLFIATIAWFSTAVAVWFFREKFWRDLARRIRTAHRTQPEMRESGSSIHRRVK